MLSIMTLALPSGGIPDRSFSVFGIADGTRVEGIRLLAILDQLAIEIDGLVCNGRPTELLFDALASGAAKTLAFLRIGEQLGKTRGEIAREALRICRETGNRIVLEGNEIAGFAIDDDFLDAAGSAGNNGSSAGHRFEIDDAERFVNRRAAENTGVAVELDHFGLADHLLNPDNVRIMGAGFVDLPPHFSCNFGCIRRAGTKNHLRLRRQVAKRIDKVRYAFLPRDPADKQDVGRLRIDAVAFEGSGGFLLLIFF